VTSYHTYTPERITAQFCRGFRSAADERAWTLVVATSLPLKQLRDSLWLIGVVSHLLQANSLNDIGFNPRSARWEEQLVLLWRRKQWSFYGGLLHFCKHEIDNADPPNTDEPVVGYQPTKRVIILHGPFGGLRYQHQWTSAWQGAAEVRAFFFAIAKDYRIRGNDEFRWSRLRTAVAVRFRLLWHGGLLRKFGELSYRLAMFQAPLMGRHEYRIEIGGAPLALPIAFVVYGEQLFDDLSRPFPHPSRSIGVGVRWVANE
jgi:hypothetical protein